MMKILIFTFFLAFTWSVSFAQRIKIDSLKHQLTIAKHDTDRVLIMVDLCDLYHYFNFDSATMYCKKGLVLSRKINFFRGEIRSLISLSGALKQQGEIPKSMELLFSGLQIAQERHYVFETAMCLHNLGDTYWSLKDYSKAISFCKRARQIIETMQNDHKYYSLVFLANLYIGISYSELNQLDSAFVYLNKNYNLTLSDQTWHPVALTYLSEVLFKQGKHQMAFKYLHQAIELNKKNNDRNTNADAYKIMAWFFKEISQTDSSIYYAKKGLTDAQVIGYKLGILEISKLLADQYLYKDVKTAHSYLRLAMSVNDELYGAKKVQDLQKIITGEQERIREIELARIAYQNQLEQYVLMAGLGVLVLIAFLLYRNNRQKQKANNLLHRQKDEIDLQRNTAQKALTKLKSTQTQLIQSEKLASLGELTAGIAHEIQNPLNFVNNFSELSEELVDEMEEELKAGNPAIAIEIAADVKQNLSKISHHGKRASSIVKGMLEHSRTTTGERKLTDINALADEYLRLAYHGMKAKDKNFNSDYELIPDKNLPQIKVVPQQLGRVLLNLINNAFYALNERIKQKEAGYQSKIIITTKVTDNQIEIRVQDNGIGMSEATKAKIFQPFFTTKPTGEGTGLGLSLAYDIVTKGHGGTIEVESIPHEGTAFIVKLPM